MNKFLKTLGYAWGALVCFYIFIKMMILVPLPKGLSFFDYFWQVFLKLTTPFVPFVVANFIFAITLFSPCIVFFRLSRKLEKKQISTVNGLVNSPHRRSVRVKIIAILNFTSATISFLSAWSGEHIFALMGGILFVLLGVSIWYSNKLKLLFYFIILPLPILNSYFVIYLAMCKDISIRYRDFAEILIFIVIPVITCIVNIYYLTRPKVKEQFK